MKEKEKTTIAIPGTDTMVGWVILLFLREEGYEIRWWKPPTGPSEGLMERVDLLLIPPDLIHRRCEESLAALRGSARG